MKPYTAADIDSGYAAVTPLLYIGEPPFPATMPDNPVAAKLMIEAGETVFFFDSTTCYVTLILLGVSSEAAQDRLRLARFGPLAAS
jgi:hypothetical protein